MSKSKIILIVEDNIKNKKLFKDILELNGYQIIEADNGNEGVNCAKKYLPDLILMDWQMPVMNGEDAIKMIKADSKLTNIPIIVITASAMTDEISKVASSNCDDYITKPINVPQFIKKVSKFVPNE